MINIVICDDDKEIVTKIKATIDKMVISFDEKILIHSFYNAEDVEIFLKENRIDYIFLDIQLQGKNGFDLAEKILEKYEDTRIVFVSNYEERVFEALRYNPPKFVRKSKFANDMDETIELLKKWIEESLQSVKVIVNNEEITIKAKQITYIDTYHNYITYHLINNLQVKERKTIKRFVEENKYNYLLQINVGCVVNLIHVKNIKNRRVNLNSGESFGIGRDKEKEIKKKFLAYKLELEEVF